MTRLSVTILTFNEQQRIATCLESVKDIADEIIIVDSMSTDATLDICRQYGCKISLRKFDGYGAMRQYATSLTTNNYVLSIDADEVVSTELARSIARLKEQGITDHRVYTFNRLNYYCGFPVRHCGWHPDPQIRLFDKRYANWNLRDISERVIFRDSVNPQPVAGDLLHYTCMTPEQYHANQQRQAAIRSRVIAARFGKPWPITPYVRAAASFLNTFIAKGGFRDGETGLAISREMALTAFSAWRGARALTSGAADGIAPLPADNKN